MKSRSGFFLSVILSVIMISVGAPSLSAAPKAMPEEIRKSALERVIEYKEGALGGKSISEWMSSDEFAEYDGAIWYILSLGREYELREYREKLSERLKNAEISGAVTRLKYALALTAAGNKNDEFVKSAADEDIGEQGIMSWVFGLHLLNNGVKSAKYSADEIVEELLDRVLSDGGWALSGNKSDVDVTAMVLQALAVYRENERVAEVIEGALEFLSEYQLESGGYSSYGQENCESAAQTVIALASLGIDASQDERFIKNGTDAMSAVLEYQKEDGSFSHTKGTSSNEMSTSQSLCALVALEIMEEGGSVYIFEEKEAGLPEVSDSGEAGGSASEEDGAGEELPRYKVWVFVGIGAAAAIAILVLFVTKRGNAKNCIFVLIVSAALAAGNYRVDIKSTEDYYSYESLGGEAVGSVSITIRCDAAVGKTDLTSEAEDGVILPMQEIEIARGDSVYDVLIRVSKREKIAVNASGGYISGIAHLREFAAGELSGWVYRVNGEKASVGSDRLILGDGDVVEWLYSCDAGKDLEKEYGKGQWED